MKQSSGIHDPQPDHHHLRLASALQLSLQSALAQTHPSLEIIVADNGSRPETAEPVRKIGSSSPIPLVHSWQQDRGFRVARSRNKAMAIARGAYVVLIDGDMILEPHFVTDHWRHARPGFFVQGRPLLRVAG